MPAKLLRQVVVLLGSGLLGCDLPGTSESKGAHGQSDGDEDETGDDDARCNDGVANGRESDIDCGGPDCAPCGQGRRCEEADDCTAAVCHKGACQGAACGDGVVNLDSEQCDAAGESAWCDEDCTAAYCGDGHVNAIAGELCDGGASSASCDGDCTPAVCGDGTVNAAAGEQCDDEAQTQTCDADCSLAHCGDGTVNPLAGEVCDDGGESQACDLDCTPPACGDGIVNRAAGEQCDAVGESETCNANCTLRFCGDGITNAAAGETCDDAGASASCDDDCTAPACGDAVTNTASGEQCDAQGDVASCDADCTLVMCGDGYLNTPAGETCDDAGDSATCDDDCSPASCGDGHTNLAAGEQCDDSGESATCDGDCTLVLCGDGHWNTTAGEACDAGGESETCDIDCTLASCGDGSVNHVAGEQCDSGGIQSEACEADCRLPACGDGLVNPATGETCDDAGETTTCDLDCSSRACGDGIVNATAGEQCDSGIDTATCDTDCSAAYCGDGYVNVAAGESCDDAGNSAVCDWNCSAAVCGDGLVNPAAAEACDDGNGVDSDGCRNNCTIGASSTVIIAGGVSAGAADIRVTTDGGTTWQTGSLPALSGPVFDLESGANAVIALVNRQTVLRSTDGGLTWSALDVPVVPRDDTMVFHKVQYLAGRWFLGGRGQIAVSDDDGATWTLVHDDATVKDGYGDAVPYNTFARLGNDVIAGASREGPYYTLRSTDGGATWGSGLFSNSTNMPGSGSNCTTLRMVGESGKFYAGASSICDNIIYDALDVWTNTSAVSTSNWTQITPASMSPRFWGLGGDGAGNVMILWGTGTYTVDRIAFFAAGSTTASLRSLPSSSATWAYDEVLFADGAWWIARGPVSGAEASIVWSDDEGQTWSSIPEPGVGQVYSLAVQ